MANKLEDFRLHTYDERSRLLSALQMYRDRWGADDELEALTMRLSRTECQPGGCPYCNDEAAAAENERYEE